MFSLTLSQSKDTLMLLFGGGITAYIGKIIAKSKQIQLDSKISKLMK